MRALPGGVALAVAAFAPAAASGQTFHAGCTDGLGDTGSLASAIVAANTAPGPDVVALGAGCTYLFEKWDNNWYGPNALPPIASDSGGGGAGAGGGGGGFGGGEGFGFQTNDNASGAAAAADLTAGAARARCCLGELSDPPVAEHR